jgi:hypothetical protein
MNTEDLQRESSQKPISAGVFPSFDASVSVRSCASLSLLLRHEMAETIARGASALRFFRYVTPGNPLSLANVLAFARSSSWQGASGARRAGAV